MLLEGTDNVTNIDPSADSDSPATEKVVGSPISSCLKV